MDLNFWFFAIIELLLKYRREVGLMITSFTFWQWMDINATPQFVEDITHTVVKGLIIFILSTVLIIVLYFTMQHYRRMKEEEKRRKEEIINKLKNIDFNSTPIADIISIFQQYTKKPMLAMGEIMVSRFMLKDDKDYVNTYKYKPATPVAMAQLIMWYRKRARGRKKKGLIRE